MFRRATHPCAGMRLIAVAACLTLSAFVAPCVAAAAGNGKIAFMGSQNGNAEIFVVNPDGSGLTNLTNNPANDQFPAWSRDGQKIAFVRNFDIFVMNADGTGQIQTDQQPGLRRTAYLVARRLEDCLHKINRFSGNYAIFVMNADGTGQTKLTNNPSDQWPAWSPDGSRIAFTRQTAFTTEIFVMNTDGTGQTNPNSAAGKGSDSSTRSGRSTDGFLL